MKIVYVINKMANLAGIERILTCKMNYMSEKTIHSVFLVTYEQGDHPLPFQLNKMISYHAIDAPIPRREGFTLLKWIKEIHSARKVFKSRFFETICAIRPDIVICTGYAFPILDIIINISQRTNSKTIIESHVKSETVTMKYFVYNNFISKFFTIWDYYIFNKTKNANCIVTLTQEDKEFWTRYARRVEVIPNLLTVSPQKVKDYHVKRVVAAGRYVNQKGFDMLLEAWHILYKDIKDWHLYIFGNESRIPYQRIVDNYNMNNCVHLMPATQEIVEEFSKSSIFVLSSRFEGFGLVLAEAMSCGLPCVSFDCPFGPRDIITNNEDGILVENGNILELARAIEQLMTDETLRRTMGEKAAKNIIRFSPDYIMNKWNDLFNSL